MAYSWVNENVRVYITAHIMKIRRADVKRELPGCVIEVRKEKRFNIVVYSIFMFFTTFTNHTVANEP